MPNLRHCKGKSLPEFFHDLLGSIGTAVLNPLINNAEISSRKEGFCIFEYFVLALLTAVFVEENSEQQMIELMPCKQKVKILMLIYAFQNQPCLVLLKLIRKPFLVILPEFDFGKLQYKLVPVVAETAVIGSPAVARLFAYISYAYVGIFLFLHQPHQCNAQILFNIFL